MKISLVVVTDGSHLDNLKRAIDSTVGLVEEVVIVYQGKDREVYSKIESMATFSVMASPKGNADPDRNFAYELAGGDWILALDDDEYIDENARKFIAQITISNADVVWFKFKNYIDGVDMIDILGDDPHPRLWRKRPGLIVWPDRAHTFPQINSPMQYFAQSAWIIHDRKFEDVLSRYEERGRTLDQSNRETEDKFIAVVKSKLGKK